MAPTKETQVGLVTGNKLVLAVLFASVSLLGCGSKDDAAAGAAVDKSSLTPGAKGPAVTKSAGQTMDPEQKAAIELEQGKK